VKEGELIERAVAIKHVLLVVFFPDPVGIFDLTG
jgi:hypothetical protein